MDEAASLVERLRDETRDLHTYAERRPLQRSFVSGSAPRQAYVEYLGQMMHVHRVLEAELRTAADVLVTVEAMLEADRFHEPRIRADLAFFGVDPASVEILPATRALCTRIREIALDAPAGLMGMLYVLESSTNGSRFIANILRRAYGIEEDRGLSYMDPYGEQQPDRWHDFKHRMTRIAWEGSDADAMVESAAVMFRGIAEISDAIAERAQVRI